MNLPRLRLLAALALLLLYGLPLLLDVPLFDPDEGLHAAIAREMVGGDWIVPRFLGEPFLDKPILFFWAQAASLAALGAHEAAIRLPGLLFTVAAIATTGLLARELFVLGAAPRGPRHETGAIVWWTVIVAATMAVPFAVAQAPVHDVALVPWTNLALAGYWRLRHDAAPRRALLCAGVGCALGLSILTKGFSGIALVGLAYGGYLLGVRRLSVRAIAEGGWTLTVAVLVALPWYAAMEARQPGYLHYYFVERHLLGFTTGTQTHGGAAWWFYIPVILGGSLPWTGWLWPAARDLYASWQARLAGREALVLLWIWLAVDTAFLTLGSSKLLTYALPLFPAVALLCGWAIARASAAAPLATRGARAAFWLGVLGLLLLPVAAYAAVPIALLVPPHRPTWLLVLPAALGALWAWRGLAVSFANAMWRLAASWATVFASSLLVVLPYVAHAESARGLARYFNERGALPAHLLIFDERIGSFVFYLSPALRAGLSAERIRSVTMLELRAYAAIAGPDDVVAVPRRRLPRVRTLHTETAARRPVDRYVLYPARDLLTIPGSRP